MTEKIVSMRSLILVAAIALFGCSVDPFIEPEIQFVGVTPIPVPKPQAENPSTFRLQIRISGGDDAAFSVYPADLITGLPMFPTIRILADTCGKCNGSLQEFVCKSSLHPTDAQLRNVTCGWPNHPSIEPSVYSQKVGKNLWLIRAVAGGHSSKDVTALFVDDEQKEFIVELH